MNVKHERKHLYVFHFIRKASQDPIRKKNNLNNNLSIKECITSAWWEVVKVPGATTVPHSVGTGTSNRRLESAGSNSF